MSFKYSVIVPYRDRYELLCAALESVPDREDIQILVVDNGQEPLSSTEVPSRSYARVEHILSDPSKGAGCARNVGLDRAQGRFLLFLDADDRFDADAFSVFDGWADKGFDIVYFDVRSIRLEDGTPGDRTGRQSALVEEYFRTGCEDGLRFWYVTPWGKLFDSAFVRECGARFDEVRVSNDLMFSVRTGSMARRISACRNVVYLVTETPRNTSLTSTRSRENQFVRFQVAVSQYEYVESIGRKDMRFHLLSYVLHALIDFGPKEFFRYLAYAFRHRVNIFLR